MSPGHNIRLDFVTLRAGARVRAIDRIEHPEELARLVSITHGREGNQRPHRSMRVLPAILANPGYVALDVSGIVIGVVETAA